MRTSKRHRKRIKHREDRSHARELTFSCYRRMPLLTNDVWREMFARAIDRALEHHDWRLTAFVFMPEHVHLLVYPIGLSAADIESVLKAIKRPYSFRIKQILIKTGSPLVKRLTIRQRPGIETFRYWQEGPGYDRNPYSPKAVASSIGYLHENPVRRRLCRWATDWRWSSARWYASDGNEVDDALPTLTRIPAEFWD